MISVAIINPSPIQQYSRIFDEDKTSSHECFRIAEFFSMGKFNTSVIREEKFAALQRLTRSRIQLISQLIECNVHFLNPFIITLL